MPRLRTTLVCALLALGVASMASAKKHSTDPTAPPSTHHARSSAKGAVGEFDYYVMALSWSPTFCQTHANEEEQCGHKGYGFVLHGLWPQYEAGGGPERCETDDEPDRKTIANALAFMPSRHLVEHEWQAPGACTGLKPDTYFELADHAFAAVHVPAALSAPRVDMNISGDDLRDAFKRANPTLKDDMLNLHCSHGELVEVRFCLDKSTGLRSCGKRMRNACPATTPFTIPATR
ncbi:MAG: ribonuclease T2 [Dokdonella sp.]